MEEMEMETALGLLFSSRPKTFKMDRRSVQANTLKDTVLKELPRFLDNYTDEDLAEYIMVLVCNGKNQNQTRDDLEAFLGDATEIFVAWLWNHLSDGVYLEKSCLMDSARKSDPEVATDRKNEVQEHEVTKEPNSESHAMLSISSHSNVSDSLEAVEDLPFSGHKDDALLPVSDIEKRGNYTSQPQKSSGITDCNVNKMKGFVHSEIRCCPEIPSANIRGRSFEDGTYKIGKIQEEASQHQSSSPRKDVASGTFRSESSNVLGTLPFKHASGKPLCDSVNLVQSEDNQPRRSVWDRLGRPSGSYSVKIDAEVQLHAKRKRTCNLENVVESGLECLDLISGQFDTIAGEITSSTKASMESMPQREVDVPNRTAVNRMMIDHSVTNKKQKWKTLDANHDENSLCISDCGGDKGSLTKENNSLQQISSTFNGSHSLQESFGIPGSSNSLSKLTGASNATSTKMPMSLVAASVQASAPDILTAKQNNIDFVAESGNHRPARNGVQDLSSQLRQVERKIFELRSKQAQILKDVRHPVQTGPRNHQEDMDSRTAFVSNVHFAASREALKFHFSKCGSVAKVTILLNPHTGHPTGSAYIAFISKDSLEKALLLNGTSFMSRALKVMRKAEMPDGVLDDWQKKSSNYHLKWSREQLGSGESSATSGPS